VRERIFGEVLVVARVPSVIGGFLQLQVSAQNSLQCIELGSPAWFEWLEDECNRSFSFKDGTVSYTARRERQRNGWYWYAYRKQSGKLRKVYLGKSPELSAERLLQVATRLVESKEEQVSPVPDEHHEPVGRTIEHDTEFLMAHLTPLLGREKELQTLCALLRRPSVRLLTLAGMGGIGKTRLAIQLVSRLREEYPDGAYFIPLSTITDGVQVILAIADVLGLRDVGAEPFLEYLARSLEKKRLLLLLDNFEQVITAAPLLVELLARCPYLKVVVTSRMVLRVRGEYEFLVQALAVPTDEQLHDIEHVLTYGAVALFVQRARAVKVDFALTPENLPAVVAICRRLEGVPLALELAAARCKLLSPQALLARLSGHHRIPHGTTDAILPYQQTLHLLSRPAQDLPERQQTLRNTLDWSYNLLTEREQRLFRLLSLFAGGGSLEMIEQVYRAIDATTSILDDITSLVDKSLLYLIEQDDFEPRFSMLEIVREYGLERLHETGEIAVTQRMFAYYWLDFTLSAEAHMTDEQLHWLNRLKMEHKNIRAALLWFASQKDWEHALQMATALTWFWWAKGYLGEGRRVLEWLLSSCEQVTPHTRAKALLAAGTLSGLQGEYRHAETLCLEALSFFVSHGDRRDHANALWMLGHMSIMKSDYPRAQAYLHEAHGLFEELHHIWGVASTLERLASLERDRGDYGRARELAEQSVALFQQLSAPWGLARAFWILGLILFSLGDFAFASVQLEHCLKQAQLVGDRNTLIFAQALSGCIQMFQGEVQAGEERVRMGKQTAREVGNKRGIVWTVTILGLGAVLQGDYQRARELFEESLSVLAQLSFEYKIFTALGLRGLAMVIASQGHALWAARLAGAAASIQQTIGAPVTPPMVEAVIERFLLQARLQVGEETFLQAYAEGCAMQPAQALIANDAQLRQPAVSTPKEAVAHTALTTREIEVLRLLALGLTSPQIAEKLVISVLTVNTHVRSIYSKLGVSSRSAATRYAIEHKLFKLS